MLVPVNVIRMLCFNRIISWFQTKLQIAFTGAVTDMQWRSGVFGSVGEIGVYMGKYSAVLAHNVLPSAGERFFAADIFQKKTKVSAELGRLQTYLSNMGRWGFSPNASRDEHVLHLWTDSSIFFSKAVLLRWRLPAVRLLSVDGGHIRPVVINDFMRAACVMREGGVIVFDDALNTAHPGVQQGIKDFFDLYGAIFRPLVAIGNKLFVCTYGHFDIYREYIYKHLLDEFNLKEIKDTRFLGNGSTLFVPINFG